MNHNSKYFRNINCIEDLKSQYKRLAFTFHPDMVKDESLKDSALEEMKLINSEYSDLFKIYKNVYKNSEGETYETSHPTNEIPQDFINIIQEVIHMHGFKTYNNYDLIEYVTCQKSFAGYDENYKKFYDTVEDINKFKNEKYRLERIELEKKFKNFNDD